VLVARPADLVRLVARAFNLSERPADRAFFLFVAFMLDSQHERNADRNSSRL
jgi:hypothetical protein